MHMLDLLYVVIGLTLLVVGGEFLVRSSIALSFKFHLSKMIIGLTVVSFATSSPELFVSVQAALDGYPFITLGNIVGSNIANIGLVLGISAIISPLIFDRDFYKFNWPVMMVLSIAMYFLLFNDQEIGRLEGGGLIAALIIYLWVIISRARKNRKERKIKAVINDALSTTSNFKITIWLLIGGVSLWGGSELLIRGAVGIAEYFEVSNRIIAITIIAIGTSIPELAVSVIAAFKNEKALLIGNIIGSNIFNIASVIGITAIIHPISVLNTGMPLILSDILWMIGFAASLLILAFLPRKLILTRNKGIFLFIAYSIFIALIFLNNK